MIGILKQFGDISMGYTSRKAVEPSQNGSYMMLQARDVDASALTYSLDSVIRFDPQFSVKGSLLRSGDILFMGRGSRNFSILLTDVPDGLIVAAASFFIIRVHSNALLPAYLSWYLNTGSLRNYFQRHRGKGVHMPVVRRSVLENVELPIPSIEIQNKIVEINSLSRVEQGIVKVLSDKRQLLVETACLQAARR